MNAEFLSLALDAIAPSPTQPRKHFDEAKLLELADSIKAGGVHEPVIVRPLPGTRVPETGKNVTHELVAGERRLRASKLAGAPTIPAIVRSLTDAQVIEIQLIENVQREGLTELEEAEGYQALIQATGMTKEALGLKVGRSRRYVYARLQLLSLSPTAQEALRSKKIEASVALRIACIPNEGLQNKVLKSILEGSREWIGGQEITRALTFREVAALIQHDYMLQLKDARFDIKDVTLIEGVPECKACPKRTGANPDMFEDVKGADVCTDPQCFHQKEDAHDRRQVAEAKAAGKTIIVGKAADELHGSSFMPNAGFTGYKRLDDAADSPVSGTPLRKLIGAQMKAEGIKEVLIEGRKKGQMVACLPNDVANRLVQLAQNLARTQVESEKPKAAQQALIDLADRKEDERAKKAQEKAEARYEQGWRDALLKRTWETMNKVDDDFFKDSVHRFLLLRELHGLSTDDDRALSTLLGLGEVGASASLREHARTTDRPDLMHLLVLMQKDVGRDDRYYEGVGGIVVYNAGLMLVAKAVHGEAETKSIIKQEQAAANALHLTPKKAAAGKPQKPSLPLTPAAQADGGRGKGKGSTGAAGASPAKKGKISAEEAQLGIAAAMQGNETASAPGGAVAPALTPAQAWPFPVRAETKPGGATAPQGDKASAPADAAEPGPQDEGQAVDADLLKRAVKAVKKAKSASVRVLKAELGIGTGKAMKLIDALEAAGYIGPAQSNAPREVLA